jgi:hypothetical protein
MLNLSWKILNSETSIGYFRRSLDRRKKRGGPFQARRAQLHPQEERGVFNGQIIHEQRCFSQGSLVYPGHRL